MLLLRGLDVWQIDSLNEKKKHLWTVLDSYPKAELPPMSHRMYLLVNNGQSAPQTLHAAVNGTPKGTANGLPKETQALLRTQDAPTLTVTLLSPLFIIRFLSAGSQEVFARQAGEQLKTKSSATQKLGLPFRTDLPEDR